MFKLSAVSPQGYIEAIREHVFPDVVYPNDYYRDAFRQYLVVAQTGFHFGCRRVLELGAGLSTLVLGDMAVRNGGFLHSIDASFDRYTECVPEPLQTKLADHIKFHKAVSTSVNELESFYHPPRTELFGLPPESVLTMARELTLRNCPDSRWRSIRTELDAHNWDPVILFLENGCFKVPSKLLDRYSETGNFGNQIEFLKNQHHINLAEFNAEVSWDMVFFDSGELTTMIDWEIMKSRLKSGALVAFHDIFFPKSFKNFLPAAAIMIDPGWEVLYVDNSNIQGLLIARKK